MSNDVLTASRMSTHLRCQRQSYWKDEVGLRSTYDEPVALAFGSAWARGMESRWRGGSYEEALAAALPDGLGLDPYAVASVAALLAGYYRHWGDRETFAQIHPEQRFALDLGAGWTAQGKMDGLGTYRDGRLGIVEGKTTRSKLEADSNYWMRLRFNVQVLQYAGAARSEGWDVNDALYDVARKPMLKPRDVPDRDADGFKIVHDREGFRVWNPLVAKSKAAPRPRQTGDEERGWTVQTHVETPDEYHYRIQADVYQRPEHYFARREIPILDGELEDFEHMRFAILRQIIHNRSMQVIMPKPEWAWPRSVFHANCSWCPYAGFCLGNVSVDPASPPSGFSVQPHNPELKDPTDDSPEDSSPE